MRLGFYNHSLARVKNRLTSGFEIIFTTANLVYLAIILGYLFLKIVHNDSYDIMQKELGKRVRY